MTTWQPEYLNRIGNSTELQLASRRADGTIRPFVTIWVVQAAGALYVRSAYGPDNPWFRGAKASGLDRVRACGIERDVAFTEPAADAHDRIDAAYHAKYDRYGPGLVGTVVGHRVIPTTLRLDPLE